MLAQLRMIKKLGPMKKVLGMIPGMGQLADLDVADDKRMVHMEALFTSMTPRERLHPEVIDMSRRRRIARGAGQDVGSVAELLKSFKAMQRMMKEMNKLGLGAKLGAKQKRKTLEGLSPTGELAAPGGGGLGFGGLGGLGGLFGGGGGGAGPGGLPEGFPGLGGGGPGGAAGRPRGSSATRKSASKRKDKEKRKKQKKSRRRK
jgi:signal recognition particle subunit SRP54